MKNKINKQDKGTAGLTILLSVVVMLFVIGLIVMIFSLMGAGLEDATYTTTAVTVTNETGFFLNGTTYTVDNAGANQFASFNVTGVQNLSDGAVVLLGNITQGSAGTIVNATNTWNGAYEVFLNYTYTYGASNTATDIMNDTRNSVAGAVDWFDIFIVITAMVVLILLTVIIITAIRSSGMVAGMSSGGNSVGTA